MFLKRYSEILTRASATKELGKYNRAKASISTNKSVSFGLVPLYGAIYAASEYKFPGAHLARKQTAGAAILGIAMLTNLWAFQARQSLPQMEDQLIDRYVLAFDDATMDAYLKGSRFPHAK